MASAFSQSTFLSADNVEPSPPPPSPTSGGPGKGARVGGRRPRFLVFLPPACLLDPGLAGAPERMGRMLARGRALPCWLPFGSWRWQELPVLPGSVHCGAGEQEPAQG